MAGVLAIFFAPVLLRSEEFQYRDTGRMHAPMKQWIADELARGRIPQWNPYAGLGSPVLANATDALQHPFNAALLALPLGAAMKAWILLSYALAAAGAFAWARALGRSPAGCAVAALAFAFSGPLVSACDNVTFLTTYATLPWMFAAAHRFAARAGPLALAWVGLASAATAAAGDPQAWGIAVGLVPAYSVAVAERGARRRALLRGAVAAGAAVLAAAPFVLPLVEWLPHSSRVLGVSIADATRWNVHPRRLPELVIPELLRGAPDDPLSPVFAAYAADALTPLPWFVSLYLGAGVVALVVAGARRDRVARLLAVAALVFAWAALGPHAGFGALTTRLPLLGAFRYWEKLMIWVALFAALAASAGVEQYLEARWSRRLTATIGAAAAALLAAAAFAALAPGALAAIAGGPPAVGLLLAGNVASGAARAGLVLALLAVAAAARGRLPRAAPVVIVALVALDLVGGNAGAYVLGPADPREPPPLARPLGAGARVLTPFEPRADRWPELGRMESIWRWFRRTLAPSWNVPLRVGTDHDYVALHEVRWERYRRALGIEGRIARMGLFGFSAVVVPGEPALAARAGVAPPLRILAEDPELPAWLVAVPHRPRAYVAERVDAADEAAAFAFAVAGGEEGRTVVEAPVPPGAGAAAGEARIVRDVPGETVVEARADRPALLVLNDAFTPGWTATVDGTPAPIQRANALVRGVWIAAGSHEVRFRYATPGLRAGWAVALALAAALGAWSVVRRRRRARDAGRGPGQPS